MTVHFIELLIEGTHHIEATLDITIAGELKVLFRTNDFASLDAEKVGEVVPRQCVITGISDAGAHTKLFTDGTFPTDMLA